MNLKQPAALSIHLKQLERRGSAEASFFTIKRRKMVMWTTPIWLLRNNAPYTESLSPIVRLRNETVKGGAFLLCSHYLQCFFVVTDANDPHGSLQLQLHC